MILGIDYWNTATQNPAFFAALAHAIRAQGGKVYIITAVGAKRAETNTGEVEKLGIPNDGIHQVIFTKDKKAPQLKADKCVELGIELFIDDRRDICEAIFARGIMACNIIKPAQGGIVKPGKDPVLIGERDRGTHYMPLNPPRNDMEVVKALKQLPGAPTSNRWEV
jgi:hypothetical protein